jgi:hypothetical protein
MSGRQLKNRVLMISAVALVATTFPLMIADAGDSTSTFMPNGVTAGPAIAPILPAAAPVVMQPVLPQPQIGATVNVASVAASGNPFVLAPTATAVPATAVSNPFALQTAVVAPLPNTDAAPFALQSATGASNPATVASLTEDVDVTALRYYAGQRDMARVGAETRRLKSLYPGWEAPADLFVVPTTVDEQPLWDLFAQGLYADARHRIEELKVQNPGWLPSTDLSTKLSDAEARVAMRMAYSLGNWDQVIAVAQQRSTVLVCDQIDSLWQVGEALAHKSNFATSFDTFKYILLNCNNPDERLATMQKASLVLPATGINALVLLGRPLPDGTSEFMSVGFDNLRNRIVSNINDRFESEPVTPEEMERFTAYVRTTRAPADLSLVAWYYYAQKEWDVAEAWFSIGTKSSREPKFMEGQILAMRAGGKSDLALEFAAEVKDRSPELAQQYIELVAEILSDPQTTLDFPKRDLKDFEEFVVAEKSALGAQAVGWRYIEDENLKRASNWFERSMDWDVTEGGVIGQAVVASRLKQNKTLRAIKDKYGDDYAELDDFKVYSQSVRKSRSVSVRSTRPAKVSCNNGGLLDAFICGRS